MIRRKTVFVLSVALAVVPLAAWPLARSAGQSPANRDSRKFVFAIVESFDAKYLGDTAGHVGRGGGLGESKPGVALGDPVFRGEERIGRISSVVWDRSKGSLEIEIDPESMRVDPSGHVTGPLRIAIGDEVWTPLGGPQQAEKGR